MVKRLVIFKKMGTSRSLIVRGAVNLLIDVIAALPVLILFLVGEPTERGFFCDDESIRYPYKNSTVPNSALYSYGFLVPLVVIVAVEFFGRKQLPQIGPNFVVNIIMLYIGFLFGAAISQTLTDTCKYTVGRLRPHFIQVCQPEFSSLTCTDDFNQPIFVTDYICQGNGDLFNNDREEMMNRVKEARVSFLSGHSSFSFQASVFVVMYLQSRVQKQIFTDINVFAIPFLQFLAVAAAALISLSRVTDYKHHPTDVISGAILGTVVQLLNTVYVMRLFKSEAMYQSIDGKDTEKVEPAETHDL